MVSIYQGRLLFCRPCFAYALNVMALGCSKGRWCCNPASGGWSYSPLLKCNFYNALGQLTVFPCPFGKQRKTQHINLLVAEKIKVSKNAIYLNDTCISSSKLEISKTVFRNSPDRWGLGGSFLSEWTLTTSSVSLFSKDQMQKNKVSGLVEK